MPAMLHIGSHLPTSHIISQCRLHEHMVSADQALTELTSRQILWSPELCVVSVLQWTLELGAWLL